MLPPRLICAAARHRPAHRPSVVPPIKPKHKKERKKKEIAPSATPPNSVGQSTLFSRHLLGRLPRQRCYTPSEAEADTLRATRIRTVRLLKQPCSLSLFPWSHVLGQVKQWSSGRRKPAPRRRRLPIWKPSGEAVAGCAGGWNPCPSTCWRRVSGDGVDVLALCTVSSRFARRRSVQWGKVESSIYTSSKFCFL